MKFAKLTLDFSIVKYLGVSVGEILCKGNTDYYRDLQQKWDNNPIVITKDGVKVPSDKQQWRLFLARCIRSAVKKAWSNGEWDVSESIYNNKLKALLYFESNGTFIIPRSVNVDNIRSKRSEQVSKIKDNESRLKYLVPIFHVELKRQIGELDQIFPDMNLSRIKKDFGYKFSFADGVICSAAGWRYGRPYAIFALSRFLKFEVTKTSTFYEYDSFMNDPEIGTLKDCTLGSYITVLISHELSHVLQYELCVRMDEQTISSWRGHDFTAMDKNHGAAWQDIYRDLRNWAMK